MLKHSSAALSYSPPVSYVNRIKRAPVASKTSFASNLALRSAIADSATLRSSKGSSTSSTSTPSRPKSPTAGYIATQNSSAIVIRAQGSPNIPSNIMTASDVSPNNDSISDAARASTKSQASTNVWDIKKGQQTQSQSNSPPLPPASQNFSSVKQHPSSTPPSSHSVKATEQQSNGPPHKIPRNEVSNVKPYLPSVPPSLDDRETWPEVGQASTVSSSHVSTPVNEHESTQQQHSHASRKNEKAKWIAIPPEELQAAADQARMESSRRSGVNFHRNGRSGSRSIQHSRVQSAAGSAVSSPRRDVKGRALHEDHSSKPSRAASPAKFASQHDSISSSPRSHYSAMGPNAFFPGANPALYIPPNAPGNPYHMYPPPVDPAQRPYGAEYQPPPHPPYPSGAFPYNPYTNGAPQPNPYYSAQNSRVQTPQFERRAMRTPDIPPLTNITRPPRPEESEAIAGYRVISMNDGSESRSHRRRPELVFGSAGVDAIKSPGTVPINVGDESTAELERGFKAFTIGVGPGDMPPPRMRKGASNGLDDSKPDVVDMTNYEAKIDFGTTKTRDGLSPLLLAPMLPFSNTPIPGETSGANDGGLGLGMGPNNEGAITRREPREYESQQREHGPPYRRGRHGGQGFPPSGAERNGLGGGSSRYGGGRRGRDGLRASGRGYGGPRGQRGHAMHGSMQSGPPSFPYPNLPPHSEGYYNGLFIPIQQPMPPPMPYYYPPEYPMYPPPPAPPMLPIPQALAEGPPMPAPVSRPPFSLDPIRFYLLGQLEYYLSHQNMAKDYFLKTRMDNRGWIPISLFASFNRVKRFTTDVNLVREVLHLSSLVQVNGDWVRMGGWEQFVLPTAAESAVEPFPEEMIAAYPGAEGEVQPFDTSTIAEPELLQPVQVTQEVADEEGNGGEGDEEEEEDDDVEIVLGN